MKKNGVKGQQIVYGFVDESGTAGAVSGDDENDFLVASVVLFASEQEMKSVRQKFLALRKELGLKLDYEFHYCHNSRRVHKYVFDVLGKMDFEFMTFAIKKDNVKRHASYANLAQMIVAALSDEKSITAL